MEEITKQDLILAAAALRQAARMSEKKAADPLLTLTRKTFERQERTEDALAAKFDRIAKLMK
jgi:hypothetical protein